MTDALAAAVTAAVDRARQHQLRNGQTLSPLAEGIVATLASTAHDPVARDELATIQAALDRDGHWSEQREWRISTWFDNRIVRDDRDGTPNYVGTVSCDGQQFSCSGPSLMRVHAFMTLYEAVIVEGFYVAGAPWAP